MEVGHVTEKSQNFIFNFFQIFSELWLYHRPCPNPNTPTQIEFWLSPRSRKLSGKSKKMGKSTQFGSLGVADCMRRL